MSGQCLRFILPPDMTAKQKEEYENCMFGVDSVVLLAILMACGERDLLLSDAGVRVRYVEVKKRYWYVLNDLPQPVREETIDPAVAERVKAEGRGVE